MRYIFRVDQLTCSKNYRAIEDQSALSGWERLRLLGRNCAIGLNGGVPVQVMTLQFPVRTIQVQADGRTANPEVAISGVEYSKYSKLIDRQAVLVMKLITPQDQWAMDNGIVMYPGRHEQELFSCFFIHRSSIRQLPD